MRAGENPHRETPRPSSDHRLRRTESARRPRLRAAVLLTALAVLLVPATPTFAAEPAPKPEDTKPADAPKPAPKPDEPAPKTDDKKKSDADKPEEPAPPAVTERVVVSASATGVDPIAAPAAVDVVKGTSLRQQAGDHLVDYLRRVPGINVVQFSARDTNIASRGSTGGINNTTAALVDDRTLYQDFLGFILWEFAPTDFSIVDRVEVVRGPASSVWGANAVGGVVHVFTLSPFETLGGKLTASLGTYDTRRLTAEESFLAGPWAVRVSGSLYEADAFDRPATITNVFGETIDPDFGLIPDDEFQDSGTEQPRLDVRADLGEDAPWILQAGYGRTRGWIATGLGPFDVDPHTALSYVQARYQGGPYEGDVYLNYFDGKAKNLINAIPFDFTSALTHASFRGSHGVGTWGVFGWGLEVERTEYDLSIAPAGDLREMGGGFAEVDARLAARLFLTAGARLDYFRHSIGAVTSPRVALRFEVAHDQNLRIAAGQAYRAPSLIETDLDVPRIPVAVLDWETIDADNVGFPFFAPLADIVCNSEPHHCGVPPGESPDYIAVTAARGSRELSEETTRSLELGYAARIGKFDLSATIYRTHSTDGIDFSRAQNYGVGPDGQPGTKDDVVFPTDPDGDGVEEAPAVDVCPYLDAIPPFRTICPLRPVPYNQALAILLDGQVPSLFQFTNDSDVRNKGVELGSSWQATPYLSAYLNYSWQSDPISDGKSMTQRVDNLVAEHDSSEDLDHDGVVANTNSFVNIPAKNRVSLGMNLDRGRWFVSGSYDYVSQAFWQDVLTSDFWGYTKSYNLVGVSGGIRFPSLHLEVRGQITNLLDEKIQQHIFGDIIRRRFTVSVGTAWGRRAGPRSVGS